MTSSFSLNPTRLAREQPAVFAGPAGSLQGLWRPPPGDRPPAGVVVVAHPHPAFGGTMLNKVVFHIARVLNHDLDLASLRFNFRGVGESEGLYDEGLGEVDDLAAAWDEARRRAPGVPLIGAGFSFGAAMTLHLAARLPHAAAPAALALMGLPLRMFEPPDPFPHVLPLAAVHGGNDHYTPPGKVEKYLESWPGPRAFQVEPDADHFLDGRLPEATAFLSQALRMWI